MSVEANKQTIERMFAAVGNHVETLERVALGGLTLGGLEPGKWRQLTQDDINTIFGIL